EGLTFHIGGPRRCSLVVGGPRHQGASGWSCHQSLCRQACLVRQRPTHDGVTEGNGDEQRHGAGQRREPFVKAASLKGESGGGGNPHGASKNTGLGAADRQAVRTAEYTDEREVFGICLGVPTKDFKNKLKNLVEPSGSGGLVHQAQLRKTRSYPRKNVLEHGLEWAVGT
ncbi:unnamed protein product, partial [Pylaiella littoralis]